MKEKLSHLSPIRQAQAEVVLNRVRSSDTGYLSPKFYEDSDQHFYLTKNEVDNAVNDLCEAGLMTLFVDRTFIEMRVTKDSSDEPT